MRLSARANLGFGQASPALRQIGETTAELRIALENRPLRAGFGTGQAFADLFTGVLKHGTLCLSDKKGLNTSTRLREHELK